MLMLMLLTPNANRNHVAAELEDFMILDDG